MINRRNFLGSSAAISALAALPLSVRWSVAQAVTQGIGLSNPAAQDKFVNLVPDAMAPGFKYVTDKSGQYAVQVREALQMTGLRGPGGALVPTPVWGYADKNQQPKVATWPGKTFEVNSALNGGPPETIVKWSNGLERPTQHLLPVDTNLHWCYSLPGYEHYSIANSGVPIITHVHGGHSDFQFDGNPEFFYNAYEDVIGPQWAQAGGFTNKFRYDNNVRAGNLWYHDHALGITRLNVYAGLAGFYFVRDEFDTGKAGNMPGLPAWPYEKAYAIQDRMFRNTGELFYSAYPGDPFYEDFITGEGAELPEDLFPGGGPTALAEFFGDHMVVNGLIWPKEDVERRNYRLRLLNGTDSRFMMFGFVEVPIGSDDPADAIGGPIPFDVIGSDQGLASSATRVTKLLCEPGSRYDVVINFRKVSKGSRVIMTNLLGDAPYGGDLPDPDCEVGDVFCDRFTDRIMAFDVIKKRDNSIPDEYSRRRFNSGAYEGGWNYAGNQTPAENVRKVALFEGVDEFGRLQPLLGHWDASEQLFKGVAWHMPTTENPDLYATEIWEIYNFTGDAHPVHLHLVNFEVLGRRWLTWDEGEETLPVMQHNGTFGEHVKVSNVQVLAGADGDVLGENGKRELGPKDGFVENAPKDMVTALPGQVTRIKATFDKPGRYVWHCHILSHEDHEMMRVLHVGPGA